MHRDPVLHDDIHVPQAAFADEPATPQPRPCSDYMCALILQSLVSAVARSPEARPRSNGSARPSARRTAPPPSNALAGRPPAGRRQRRPADQVQTTAGDAALDRLVAESQLQQLPPRHNSMLRCRQAPHLGVECCFGPPWRAQVSTRRRFAPVRPSRGRPSWLVWITRRSWVPTPIVRSASVTSTSKRSLRPSTTSRRVEMTRQVDPSSAAATCLTQTSKPTVALPSGRLLEGEDRGAVLHHPDHRRSREDVGPDRAADVGEQIPGDVELFAALFPRLRSHQTMPRPPLTPSVSPVT